MKVQGIGTYLPPWGTATSRVPGVDEDAVTLAVAAGRAALSGLDGAPVTAVVVVSRDLPLLEGGNDAPLLAGLGLGADVPVTERLGAAPAALRAVTDAAPGTLVIGTDTERGAGAAAVYSGEQGAELTAVGQMARTLPVTTRDGHGLVHDYADPRLLRERGVPVSLDRLGLTGPFAAVAGLGAREAAVLTEGRPVVLPTAGASAGLLAVAGLVDAGRTGPVLAAEQATVAVAELRAGHPVAVTRDEPDAQDPPRGSAAGGPDIAVSLPAYERAFDAKLGLEAARCTTCDTLSYPRRLRCLGCGSEAPTATYALPRDAEIYTLATIRVPVPGLLTPYTVVVAELGATGVRVLVRLTGAPAGSVGIGDRGRLVFRRVAVRTGIPDYGYGFLPEPGATNAEVAA